VLAGGGVKLGKCPVFFKETREKIIKEIPI